MWGDAVLFTPCYYPSRGWIKIDLLHKPPLRKGMVLESENC